MQQTQSSRARNDYKTINPEMKKSNMSTERSNNKSAT